VLAIQYAKASGLTVIATASASNFDYLKALGADAVFDYRSPTCGSDIRAFTKNKLRYAWDTVSGEAICAAALSDAEPSMYGIINRPSEDIKKLNPLVSEAGMTLAYDASGEDHIVRGRAVSGKQDELDFASMFLELSRKMIENSTLIPINHTENSTGSGLEGAIKGLEVLKAGKVRATKLVYTL
jgi:NADPH:quinone reductase-like Zn-dependent oxidoreductase